MEKRAYHIGIGITFGCVVLVIDTYLTLNDIFAAIWFFPSLYLVSVIVGICFGAKLPLVLKTLITSLLFINGLYDALYGRTENVGLTSETMISTLIMFIIISPICFVPLLHIWRNSQRLIIVSLFPIVSIVGALVISEIEENIFVSLYSEGKGPTKRWTINTAWLAYGPSQTDPDGEYVLRGGD